VWRHRMHSIGDRFYLGFAHFSFSSSWFRNVFLSPL
jgi:hypothetical protein